MSPLVSVIIPSYNHEKFLKERIDSVLNQTFQDFELIILDDLSPDNSREIIESYRAHPKVSHIIFNEKNSGSTFVQWNKGIDLAQGQYIWIAESDDVADVNFLSTLVPKLQENSVVGIAYCQSSRMNSKGEITGSWLDWTNGLKNNYKFNKPFQMSGTQYIITYLIHKNTIPNASAVLFRKNIYLEVKGPTVKLRTNGDWELWLKMLSISNVYYSPLILNHFRYHGNSVIHKMLNGKNNAYEVHMLQFSLNDAYSNYLDEHDVKNKIELNKINHKKVLKELIVMRNIIVKTNRYEMINDFYRLIDKYSNKFYKLYIIATLHTLKIFYRNASS
ncbi:MAG: glycosyl transferase [Acinetobacter sp.]|mgnify:CR=1 FL=1|uniref:glycosyltransferase family 2 protein n=1 Tax=Acinetobacter TaxID=469 RepID=UPI000DB6B6C1|nr:MULTISPECIES: glycosyltransferase [Acinetobacter]PZT87487.1 MAG: glycosyl transferase [Acinetobacter sp.]RSO81662.1 glycosyltransferase [Acinetobacter ursingii]